MDKNQFLKYVMKEEKEDIFHSSAYGKAQNGDGIGVSSAESFATRRKIDQNRQVIKGYGNSNLVGQAIGNGPRAKAYTPPAPGAQSGPAPARPLPPRNPGISR